MTAPSPRQLPLCDQQKSDGCFLCSLALGDLLGAQ